MQAKKSVFRPIALAVSALLSTGAFAEVTVVTGVPGGGPNYTDIGYGGIRIADSDPSAGMSNTVITDTAIRLVSVVDGMGATVLDAYGLNTGYVNADGLGVTNMTVFGTAQFRGTLDLRGGTVIGLEGSFEAAAAGALGAVTTLNAGSTYNVDLTSGAAALGAVSTEGITNTGNIATTTLRTSGLATLDSAAITNNATVGGTLAVTGATTLNGATTVNNTLNVNGATTIVGATSITGTTSISGATTVVGVTNINTTGTAATTIGNAAAAATLVGNVVSASAGNGGNSGLTLKNGEASMTVTNSLGNTHGLVVGESSTTLSGGTRSTNLTLNDNGATFSNAATGAPTRVTGVANGAGDFDAVNVRQFSSAVAGVAAAANIPGVDTNKTASVGVGMGSYMNSQALAFGGSYRFSDNGVLRASLATGLNTGGSKPSYGIGANWSW